MNNLDEPPSLRYNQGNTLPTNFKFTAVLFLLVGVGLLAVGVRLFGVVIILLALFVLTQRQIFEISEGENYVRDYAQHLGFIKIGKKYPLDKFKYITALPLVEGARIYARTNNSTTISHSYHAVTIFGNRLRGKKNITKFGSRSEAQEKAKELANRLNLKYFEYDPHLVRAVLRGERTI